jgi:hypothetical protein
MRRKRFDKLACYFIDKAAFNIILAIHVTKCIRLYFANYGQATLKN